MSDEVKRGLRVVDRNGEFKVMTVADGYAMCRRKGCIPFVVAVSAIERQLRRPSEPPTREERAGGDHTPGSTKGSEK